MTKNRPSINRPSINLITSYLSRKKYNTADLRKFIAFLNRLGAAIKIITSVIENKTKKCSTPYKHNHTHDIARQANISTLSNFPMRACPVTENSLVSLVLA